jgi:hypothetical protein
MSDWQDGPEERCQAAFAGDGMIKLAILFFFIHCYFTVNLLAESSYKIYPSVQRNLAKRDIRRFWRWACQVCQNRAGHHFFFTTAKL